MPCFPDSFLKFYEDELKKSIRTEGIWRTINMEARPERNIASIADELKSYYNFCKYPRNAVDGQWTHTKLKRVFVKVRVYLDRFKVWKEYNCEIKNIKKWQRGN